MNVGSISNMSYMGYIRPADQSGFPFVRNSSPVAPQNYQQNLPSITPYFQTTAAPAAIFFNADGDSVQFSLPALNKSMLPENPYIKSMQPEEPNTERIAPLDPNSECETCANRKYVDGSDDASVSYQTPTNISPNMAAAAVASHENEHVRNEQAKASRDGREIINQSVTIHYDTCSECGRQYVSGGTTRTTSISKSDSPSNADYAQDNGNGSV